MERAPDGEVCYLIPSEMRPGAERRGILCAAILSLVTMPGCDCSGAALGESETTDLQAPKRIVLISIDTLRADRVGAYGYDRPTSPSIDALAEEGARFETAIAESSWTLPSHMSLFTGLHPSGHGVTKHGQKLPQDVPALGQLLDKAGYDSYAFTGGGYVGKKYGYDRGFERFAIRRHKPFRKVVEEAKSLVRKREPDERYLLFLHTYDVHCPFRPAKRHRNELVTRPKKDHLRTRPGRCGKKLTRMDLTEGQVRYLSQMYDAEVRTMDEALGSFLQWMRGRDGWEDTMVVFLSDHGEAFNEHGLMGHGRQLYIELLRVPLIIAGPAVPHRVVDERVGLVDVLPTLLDLLEIEQPSRLHGRSMVPLLQGESVAWSGRPMFSEIARLKTRSIIDGPHHLIERRKRGSEELFNWKQDPREQRDLSSDEAELRKELSQTLDAHLRALGDRESVERQELTERERERLRALGYIE